MCRTEAMDCLEGAKGRLTESKIALFDEFRVWFNARQAALEQLGRKERLTTSVRWGEKELKELLECLKSPLPYDPRLPIPEKHGGSRI